MTDPRTTQFLEDLAAHAPWQHDLVIALRALIDDLDATLAQTFMYGGIIYRQDKTLVCGLFAYRQHVSLEFGQGAQFEDPHGVLEGQGKFRRHIKFRQGDSPKSKHAAQYLATAARHAAGSDSN